MPAVLVTGATVMKNVLTSVAGYLLRGFLHQELNQIKKNKHEHRKMKTEEGN